MFLVALAAAIRLVYAVQLFDTPLAQMHRWRQTDMHYFATWGGAVAAGDVRSAALPLPMHRWHRDVAAAYWHTHPEEKAAFTRNGADPDEGLWRRWMHTPRFYQDPLYAYLLATVGTLRLPPVATVILLQLSSGLVTVLLIWSLTRRAFGDTTAVVAGAGAALSAPLVFYEGLLLRDALIVCAGLAIVFFICRAREQGPAWWGATGILIGVASLLKSTFWLLGSAAFVVALVGWRTDSRRGVIRTAALAAGLALGIAPLLARNVSVGVPAFSMASSGPLTFVAANSASTLPDVGFGIDAAVLATFLGSTDGTWRSAFQTALEGQTWRQYVTLAWRKWDRAWHWYEIPNNENFYYARERIPVLRALPVTFWVCAPFAAIGLVLALSAWRRAWPLLLLVAVSALPLLGFYVLGRFRVALFAALIPFAAFGLVELIRTWNERRFQRFVPLAAAGMMVASWTGRPLSDRQVLIRTSDWILPWSVEYESRVYGALDARDLNAAATAYLEFFQHTPTDGQIRASGDPRLPIELADMHTECAQILRAAGRERDADAQLSEARRLSELSIKR